jgi:hypothetical protein
MEDEIKQNAKGNQQIDTRKSQRIKKHLSQIVIAKLDKINR